MGRHLVVNYQTNYSGPGDNKDGYNSKDYETNSLSLSDRKGKKCRFNKICNNEAIRLAKS